MSAVASPEAAARAAFEAGKDHLLAARHGAAEESFRQALELMPDLAAARYLLGHSYLAEGRHHDAIAAFEAALVALPELLELWNGYGEALQAVGRAEESVQAFERALELDPSDPAAWGNLAQAKWAQGKLVDALAAVSLARVHSPRDGRIGHLTASIIAALGQRSTFAFEGARFPYFYHPYNNTALNERTVEVPIVWREIEAAGQGRVLEVGNVLSHYFETKHDVADKYEQSPGVLNEDVVNLRPLEPYDLIVSISTLEHVGWDEQPRDPRKIVAAFDVLLRRCLAPGGRLVVTMPLGYNPNLDRLLETRDLPVDSLLFMKQVSPVANRWEQVEYEAVKGIRYDHSARGLVIAVARA